jgi:acyl transferase domain-containing protein
MADLSSAVAVVGLDIKGPGEATNPEAFFQMILQGRSALSRIPGTRFNIDAFYHPDKERTGAVCLRELLSSTRYD